MATKKSIKIVLTKAGTAYDETKAYKLHDYIIIDNSVMYICKRVDSTTMACVGHPLTDTDWWDKSLDLSEWETKVEDAATKAETVVAKAEQATTNANTATSAAKTAAAAATEATTAAKTATSNAEGATEAAKTATTEVKTAAEKVETVVSDVEKLNESVAELQKLAQLNNVFVGFARQNGAVSPEAETTYGTKALIHEIGKHFRMATVKNGVVQHTLLGDRIDKATNGDDVAIDGSDGDVLLTVRGVHLLKNTSVVDGVETNSFGLGLAPYAWNNGTSKKLPDFGFSPVATVNCKLDGDYRSCAHSVYNKDAIGEYGKPSGVFNNTYKTSGGGYNSIFVSYIGSIQNAQNKNEDALTNRPYMGGYYEFYEAILAMLYIELGTLCVNNLKTFGYGNTGCSCANATTFLDEQMSAVAGWKICIDDTTSKFSVIHNQDIKKNGSIVWMGYGAVGGQDIVYVEMLEGQRVLSGIAKNGWKDKMNTNDNIFYFGEDGELKLTTSAEVNLSTGEGMTECTRYYVARDVLGCEGMSDGVMTAVVNSYCKFVFTDGITVAKTGEDLSGKTAILKQSLPIYRGFTLPMEGSFRQLSGACWVEQNDGEKIWDNFKCAAQVEDVPPLTVFDSTAYSGNVGEELPVEKGLTLVGIDRTGLEAQQPVSKSDYSLSLFAATENKSASGATKECAGFSWSNNTTNKAGKKTTHAFGVGRFIYYFSVASPRTFNGYDDAGDGDYGYAGAFAVLLKDSQN